MAKKNKEHNDSLKKLTFEKEALEQNMDFRMNEVVTLQSEAKDKVKQLNSMKKPESLRKDVYTIDPPEASPTCYSCGRNGHRAYSCTIIKQILLGACKWIHTTLCLIATSNSPREHILWYLDNGCSRYMTKDPSIFSSIVEQGGKVTFMNNSNGKILGKDCVGMTSPIVENVYLIECLKHYLLSTSQYVMLIKKFFLKKMTQIKYYFMKIEEIMFMLSLLLILMISR